MKLNENLMFSRFLPQTEFIPSFQATESSCYHNAFMKYNSNLTFLFAYLCFCCLFVVIFTDPQFRSTKIIVFNQLFRYDKTLLFSDPSFK